MKQLKTLISYHMKAYFRSNKWIMIMAALLFMMFSLYVFMLLPVSVVSSYTLSMTGVFLIMACAGFTYNDVEHDISESIFIMKTGSAVRYYASKIICMLIWGAAVSLFCTIFPLLVNAAHGQLYDREIIWQDVLIALLLHCFISWMGLAVGSFLHSRVLRERKSAVVLTLLAAILSVAKTGIIKEIPAFIGISYLFPPVSEAIARLNKMEYYQFSGTAFILCWIAAYTLMLFCLQTGILIRNKF